MPKLDPAQAAREVAERINKARAERDQPPLEVAPRLADAALAEARDLARRDTLRRPDGGSVAFDRLRRDGHPFREVQQHTAAGYPTAEKFVASLLDSPEDADALLGDHRLLGVGYATAEDGTPYWVLLIAKPREG